MKYIQKLHIPKKKLFPTGMLLTSIMMNNNALFASTLEEYHNNGVATWFSHMEIGENSTTIYSNKYTPNGRVPRTNYYAITPEYTGYSAITSASPSPLFISMRANYTTMSGVGVIGGVHTVAGDIALNIVDGLQSFKTSISGSVTSGAGDKLVTIKETTITGGVNLTGTNTIMINYSKTGTEATETLLFTDPKDTANTIVVTVTSGSGGNIVSGNGDNVVWIGGSPKEGFGWSGQGTGYNGPSTIYGNVSLGNGNNELQIYQRSQVFGNISLGDGKNSLTIDNATIGLIIRDPYTYEYIPSTIPGMLNNGNIRIGSGENVIKLDRAEVAGNIISDSGNDSITMKSSTIYGEMSIHGLGKNTLELEHTSIYQDLTVDGNENSIVLKGGFIGKPVPYGSDSTVKPVYADITMGGTNNTLSIYYMTWGGNITGEGTIIFRNGALWEGNRTILEGQDVFVYSGATLNGNIALQSDSVTLELLGGEINGNLGSTVSAVGKLLVGYKEAAADDDDAPGSSKQSAVHGNIYASTVEIQKDVQLIFLPLRLDKDDTTIDTTLPQSFTMQATDIVMGGDIIVNPGKTEDRLEVKGTIQTGNTGSFVLDMNFEEGTHDILNLNNVTINNSIAGAGNSIVYFVPEKPLYYATLGTVLEGVVLGDASLDLGLSQTDVGGYEYELILNPNGIQWDLRLVRISASNYAYAGIVENMRNYTRHVWTNLNDTFTQDRIAKHASKLSIVPNNSTKKKVFKDIGLVAWASVNYITNTIYDANAPTIDEKSIVTTAGIGTQDIRINAQNTINVNAFMSYGGTTSQLNQYTRDHTMKMNAYTAGIVGSWDYKKSTQHTFYSTAGFWVDSIKNTVNLEGLDNNTQWSTHSTKIVGSFGYQLNEGNTIFITSWDTTYSFTKGNSFITSTNNAIDIADDHQLIMKLNALVGHSLNFGFTPFFQFTMDFPIYSSSNGIITSNGHPFSYDSEQFGTAFKLGFNYTLSIGETKLNAYGSFGIHKGQPVSTVEVGFIGSAGISYTF